MKWFSCIFGFRFGGCLVDVHAVLKIVVQSLNIFILGFSKIIIWIFYGWDLGLRRMINLAKSIIHRNKFYITLIFWSGYQHQHDLLVILRLQLHICLPFWQVCFDFWSHHDEGLYCWPLSVWYCCSPCLKHWCLLMVKLVT